MSEFSIQAHQEAPSVADVTGHGATQSYLLSGVLDFNTVPAAMPQLQALLTPNISLVLDFANIERANSAAVALMVELQAQAQQGGSQLVWANLPASIVKIAEVCEVSDFLNYSSPG